MFSASLKDLVLAFPRAGTVAWIGVRPARREPPIVVSEVAVTPGKGLAGDRFDGTLQSRRQVTLIQGEHVDAVASLIGVASLDPGLLRRNIVVRGINLLALKDQQFRVGTAVLEFTGLCHPCSRMEEALGPGGYNAMRGHGGITARVIEAGFVRLGDPIAVPNPPRSQQ